MSFCTITIMWKSDFLYTSLPNWEIVMYYLYYAKVLSLKDLILQQRLSSLLSLLCESYFSGTSISSGEIVLYYLYYVKVLLLRDLNLQRRHSPVLSLLCESLTFQEPQSPMRNSPFKMTRPLSNFSSWGPSFYNGKILLSLMGHLNYY